ncbi:MAG: hypothetical protein AAF889_12835, partial [Cyanobacteria bacterium P01_D01_bin.73]
MPFKTALKTPQRNGVPSKADRHTRPLAQILILKADVQGSLEAILGSLKQIPQNEVHIRLLLSAPG